MTAFTGDVRDRYQVQYHDQIEHELSQNGSRLEGTIRIEPGVMGEKSHFDKIGSVAGVSEHTARFEDRVVEEGVYERRTLSPTYIEKTMATDPLDLQRMVSDPRSELVLEMAKEMGRQTDSVLVSAFGGSAARVVGGTAGTVAFTSGNTLAVNDNVLAATTLSGDTPLHEGKIQQALGILGTNYVDLNMDPLFLFASTKQLTNLKQRLLKLNWGRRDFVGKEPLNIPGLDRSLDGLFGIHYIAYESPGVDGSADEYAYLYTPAAVKLGVWKPLQVEIYQRMDKMGSPYYITASQSKGAVRMDEKKVVRMLCDPNYAAA